MDSPRPRARTNTSRNAPHPYAGLTAGFATKHDKIPLVAPYFESALSVSIDLVDFDTDTLGTFSGETPRSGSAIDTALTKARIAAESSADGLGLGSEGSIGPSNDMPFVISDLEILAFVDLRREITISEYAVSHSVPTISTRVRTNDEFEDHLSLRGFPEHGVIVKRGDGVLAPVFKGLHSFEDVHEAVHTCASRSSDGLAIIESDLRANHCPSRRPTIADAALQLALRLRELCPKCDTPGWGVVSHLRGVPCSSCNFLVPVPSHQINGCSACSFRQTSIRALHTTVDPSRCPRCNP